jgi:hypothetical protein
MGRRRRGEGEKGRRGEGEKRRRGDQFRREARVASESIEPPA